MAEVGVSGRKLTRKYCLFKDLNKEQVYLVAVLVQSLFWFKIFQTGLNFINYQQKPKFGTEKWINLQTAAFAGSANPVKFYSKSEILVKEFVKSVDP